MRRAAQMVGNRRPRAGVLVAVGVLVLAAGGVGWATTRAGDPAVVHACANADNALFLSSNGSCPAGQTPLSWNQQGPQGPPGAAGQAPPPLRAFGPSSYHGGFSINAEIDQPGEYFIDGSVDLALTPSRFHNPHRFMAFCRLYSGPQNGNAVQIAHWSIIFNLHQGNPPFFVPSAVTGLVDVNQVQNLGKDLIPREIYLSCKGGKDSVWTHPAINYELTSTATFRQTVRGALPNHKIIGPGPLRQRFGTQ